MNKYVCATALIVSLAGVGVAWGQTTRPPTTAEAARAEREKKIKGIEERLRAVAGRPADPATEKGAVEELKAWITQEVAAGRDASDLALRFQNTLAAKHPAEFVAIIDIVLPKMPDSRYDQRRDLQSGRVKSLLKLRQTDEALAAFKKLLATEGPANIRQLCDDMVPVLLSLQKYGEVADLQTQLILAKPEDTVRVGEALAKQVNAYTLEKKYDKAMASAKQYFSVSLMNRTSDSMLVVAKVLPLAFPGDAGIVERFKQEQIDGQTAPAGAETQPAGTVPAGVKTSKVLAGIKVDGAAYAAAAKDLLDVDYESLMRRGNLLLLSDQAKEARQAFELALMMASEKNQQMNANNAAEGIARSIKAMDGTVGRANAWAASVSAPK